MTKLEREGTPLLTTGARMGILVMADVGYDVTGFEVWFAARPQGPVLDSWVGSGLHHSGILYSAADHSRGRGEAVVGAAGSRGLDPEGETQSIRTVCHRARAAYQGQGSAAAGFVG